MTVMMMTVLKTRKKTHADKKDDEDDGDEKVEER